MKKFLLALILLSTQIASAHTGKLNILVSINPIYSLVKNVVQDSDISDLLVNPNISPHHYQLKPSDIRKIQQADLIFIVDKNFETFLANYISKNNLKAKIIELSHSSGIKTLPARNIKVLHTHSSHDHDHHDCHHHHHDHDHDDHNHEHHHRSIDLHLWTSVGNAEAMVKQIEKNVTELNPEHAHIYKKNTKNTLKKLRKLDKEIKIILDRKVQNSPFIVFHDAYQYFEKRYNLKNAGSVAGSNFIYGPKTLQNLRKSIEQNNVQCIFAEPQFSNEVINKVAKSTNTNAGYLDIEGGSFGKNINPQDLYFFMMKQNALNIRDCVKK
jgi:zinc transport system substrate-binding protein